MTTPHKDRLTTEQRRDLRVAFTNEGAKPDELDALVAEAEQTVKIGPEGQVLLPGDFGALLPLSYAHTWLRGARERLAARHTRDSDMSADEFVTKLHFAGTRDSGR